MVTGFCKSKEGEAEYKKLGITYPDSLDDQLYEKWLQDTSADDLSKYTQHSEKEVTKIMRIKTGGDKDKEFLEFSFVHYRLDKDLNVTHRWRPNLGRYPIPIPRYVTSIGAFGKQDRQVAEVISIETGYSMPFTKNNIEKIKNLGLESKGKGKVSYSVQVPNGVKISVLTFEDLRDGDFNELVHFGKIPNTVQRQRWFDERGLEKDKEWQEQILRQKTEGNIPQRNVTADEVRNIIREDKQQKHEPESKSKPNNKPTKSTKK